MRFERVRPFVSGSAEEPVKSVEVERPKLLQLNGTERWIHVASKELPVAVDGREPSPLAGKRRQPML